MAFDPSSLFDCDTRRSPYDSVEEELQAVAAGRKAMSVFAFPNTSLGTDPFYDELCKMASQFHISIALRERFVSGLEPNLRTSYLFVFRDDEAWRVPAFLLFKRIYDNYGWSDAAEHLEGSLLGYTEEEISLWLAARWNSRVDWAGKTLFLLANSAQGDNVRMLGGRSIDPGMITTPLAVFHSRWRKPIRADALSRIPAQHELMRVSVKEDFFGEVFKVSLRAALDSDVFVDVMVSNIPPERAAALNSALQSNFQFFTSEGWRRRQ